MKTPLPFRRWLECPARVRGLRGTRAREKKKKSALVRNHLNSTMSTTTTATIDH